MLLDLDLDLDLDLHLHLNTNTFSFSHYMMYVIKRSGSKEVIAFDKILKRVKKLGTEANLSLNYAQLVMKIIEQLYDGIETSKIDELTAQQCASDSFSIASMRCLVPLCLE